MRKPRIDSDGPGAIQRLKNLSWEEIEFLLSQASEISARKVIAQIEARHGISGLSEQRLSDFWRWAQSQQALRKMNADAEQFRTEFAKENPQATLEEAHEATLAYLHLKAAREDDTKLAKFVLIELRKAREGSRDERKLNLLEAKMSEASTALQKLRDPQTADSAEERNAILDEVDRIMGLKK